jgi:hypothetical protein
MDSTVFADTLDDTSAKERDAADSMPLIHGWKHPSWSDKENARDPKVGLRKSTISSVLASSVNPIMDKGNVPKTNLTPALPAEAIRVELVQLGVDEREIRGLFDCIDFPTRALKSPELCVFQDYVYNGVCLTIGRQKLLVVFCISVSTVRHTLLHGPQETGPLGRHIALKDKTRPISSGSFLRCFEQGKQ